MIDKEITADSIRHKLNTKEIDVLDALELTGKLAARRRGSLDLLSDQPVFRLLRNLRVMPLRSVNAVRQTPARLLASKHNITMDDAMALQAQAQTIWEERGEDK